MKISGHEFLRVLGDFFNKSDPATETFLLLLLPGVLLSIILIFYNSQKNKADVDPYSNISKADFEIIENIRRLKGLEEFDRDFLLNIAFTYSVKPTRMLLDVETYERIEQMMIDKLKKVGANPAENKTLEFLLKIKKKIF